MKNVSYRAFLVLSLWASAAPAFASYKEDYRKEFELKTKTGPSLTFEENIKAAKKNLALLEENHLKIDALVSASANQASIEKKPKNKQIDEQYIMLHNKINNQRDELKEKDIKITELEKLLEEFLNPPKQQPDWNVNSLLEKIRHLENTIKNGKDKNNFDFCDEKECLKREIKDKEERISELDERIMKLYTENDQLLAQIKAAPHGFSEHEEKRRIEEIISARKNIASLEADVEFLSDENKRLKFKIEQLSYENKHLNLEMEERLKLASILIKEREDQIREGEDRMHLMEAQMRLTEEELEKIDPLRKAIEVKMNENKMQAQEIDSLKKALGNKK